MLPEWHIDTVMASPSNYISHKTEWDWMGSLERCIKQNHGGTASVVWSGNPWQSRVTQLIYFFVSCFCLFQIQTPWQAVWYKNSQSRKGSSAGLHELDMWGIERREPAVGVSHSVLRSRSSARCTAILQLTFSVGLCLGFLYTNLKI